MKWLLALALLAGAALPAALPADDFFRGLYVPPQLPQDSAHWADFAALHPNRVWNYRFAWGGKGGTEEMYLDLVRRHGMQAILRNGNWNRERPYLVEHYSTGQYQQYQAEWDDRYALRRLDQEGTHYYFFDHPRGSASDRYPGTWQALARRDRAGLILRGPNETVDKKLKSTPLFMEPAFAWPGQYRYDKTGRGFRHRVRAMADTRGQDSETVVFRLYLNYQRQFAPWPIVRKDTLEIRVKDFAAPLEFQEFWLERFVTPADSMRSVFYEMDWPGKVDLWVDWIEVLDMAQAYPLFWNDSLQALTLDSITTQCLALEAKYPGAIAGWAQSDEPDRATFRAHGIINAYLAPRGVAPTHTPILPHRKRRFDHFAQVAKVPVLDVDPYVFEAGNEVGDQAELSHLAEVLETGWRACRQQGIPLHFTGQAHRWIDRGTEKLRHPRRSEIQVQAYMALAHGATGVTYWKYLTGYSADGTASIALVDTNYSHAAAPFAEKWQAVHDVFLELKTIGDTLLTLTRETAFCAAEDPGYRAPLRRVLFQERGAPWIEVGQFRDSAGDPWLVLVNRRTEARRGIIVSLTESGPAELVDVYTGERFHAPRGTFPPILFEPGQGRVLKLTDETENSLQKRKERKD